jgi:hypothetical protein
MTIGKRISGWFRDLVMDWLTEPDDDEREASPQGEPVPAQPIVVSTADGGIIGRVLGDPGPASDQVCAQFIDWMNGTHGQLVLPPGVTIVIRCVPRTELN